MKVVIVGDAHEYNTTMLDQVMQRLCSHWSDDVPTSWGTRMPVHRIEMSRPERDGFVQWLVILNGDLEGEFVKGQSMVIGAILRPGSDKVEFHS